jgi:hypothetical protein
MPKVMATQAQLVCKSIAPRLRQNIGVWLNSTTKMIGVWIDACADASAAAALYDELRKLSDAELRSRGLTRDTIARHAFKLLD